MIHTKAQRINKEIERPISQQISLQAEQKKRHKAFCLLFVSKTTTALCQVDAAPRPVVHKPCCV